MRVTSSPRQSTGELTIDVKLQLMKAEASRLLQSCAPFIDRLPMMRAKSRELEVSLRDHELHSYLIEAQRETTGLPELITSVDAIDMSEPEWIWGGVLMAASLNLLVAPPKVGKTTLLMAVLGALHRRESSFLGRPLADRCPPVLVIGTDQPERDWGRTLLDCGLIRHDEEGLARLCDPPIIGLAHAGCPWHLDEEGIQRIAQIAEQNRGSLIIVDSLHACTRILGLNENSPELANPVISLMEAVSPFQTTVVVIHHASKGRKGNSASESSRGTNALPAMASQIIKLQALEPEPGSEGTRFLVLETEGRAAPEPKLVIERRSDGSWISHGSNATVLANRIQQEIEDSLDARIKELLSCIRLATAWTSVADLAKHLNIVDKNAKRVLRRDLKTLLGKGLIEAHPDNRDNGKPHFYRPMSFPEGRIEEEVADPQQPLDTDAELMISTPIESELLLSA